MLDTLMPSPTFARLLRQWRSREGLSQEQAAQALETKYKTYVSWEQQMHVPRGIGLKVILRRIRETEHPFQLEPEKEDAKALTS